MRVGSLFSGIGGIDLGLERAGHDVVWFAETDPYAVAVYRKQFPGRLNLGDVTKLRAELIPPADMWCAGFPCPAFSSAARGRNNAENLWHPLFHLVRRIRPARLLLENVPGIRREALQGILCDLAACRYDATWETISPRSFGSPAGGDRIWIFAEANGNCESKRTVNAEAHELRDVSTNVRPWPDQPSNLRVDDGIPDRLHRLRCIGNSVCVPVAEWIGNRLSEGE